MVLPLLALLPVAIQFLPTIAKWLHLDEGGEVAAAVGDAVSAVAGTSDPAQAAAVLSADPEKRAELVTRLAEIEAQREAARDAAYLASLNAALADVASARSQTVSLAEAHSPLQYGVVVVSVIVLLAFGFLAIAVMYQAIPTGSETLAAGLLETVKVLAVAVVSYWCGSSVGSARKDVGLMHAVAGQGGPLAQPAGSNAR